MHDDGRSVRVIAQISDTHVTAIGRSPANDAELFVDNNARVHAAIAALVAEPVPPAAVLATGDLTADGRPEEYAALVAIFAELEPLGVPVLPLPGNHDTRDGVRAAFPDVGWVDADHASWVRDVEGVRIVGLDSTRPGRPGGELDDARAAWLDAVLSVDHDGPTLLALHHPPFVTGITWMDDADFVGRDTFTEIVSRHGARGALQRIVCGHLHRPIVGSCGGVVAQVAPTTIQSVALSLESPSRVELAFDPFGYLLHRIDGGDVVTHTRWVGDYPTLRPPWAHFYEPTGD